MIRQEILHITSNNIYIIDREIRDDSQDMMDFQNSENPEDLGFILLESYSERIRKIEEYNKNKTENEP